MLILYLRNFIFLCISVKANIIEDIDAYDKLSSSTKIDELPDPLYDLDSMQCQRISLAGCRKMPWNLTKYPNLLNHRNQHDAVLSTKLSKLFYSNCSTSITQLVCGFLTPFCVDGRTISPCNSFCKEISRKCDFDDTLIDCNILNDEEPCLRLERGSIYSMLTSNTEKALCVNHAADTYSLKLADGQYLKSCGLPCTVAFSDNWFSVNPSRIRSVLLSMSILCLVLCVFTLLTFLIDIDRFRYPELSIIYICICFIPISACYAASNLYIFHKSKLLTCQQSTKLLTQGIHQLNCVLLFIFTYIPWLCSSVWFVILSFTWFLAAVLKWSHEAIGHYKVYFHLIAWISPVLIALTAISLQAITVDPVSGICTPIKNGESIRALLTTPHILYLVIGSMFLLIGFVSLFKTRNVMIYEGKHTEKLERLMFRIGLFALLYMIPSLVVCAGNYHEQTMLSKWITWWVCQQQELNLNTRCPSQLLSLAERPQLEIMAFKQIMFMSVGIVVSLWVWCPKTMISWKLFFLSCNVFGRGRSYEASV